jgi:hypothetical protein
MGCFTNPVLALLSSRMLDTTQDAEHSLECSTDVRLGYHFARENIRLPCCGFITGWTSHGDGSTTRNFIGKGDCLPYPHVWRLLVYRTGMNPISCNLCCYLIYVLNVCVREINTCVYLQSKARVQTVLLCCDDVRLLVLIQ